MRKTKSNFEVDLNGENVLANFLDTYFYAKLEIQEFFRNTPEKNNYLNNQFRGIDVTFTFNGSNFILDEKATLYYPNGIPTFAFELSYKKDNVWRQGWFYDETKETDYYLLAWPKRQAVKVSELKVEHFQTVEVLLISRKNLQNYLNEKYDINKQAIQVTVENIITSKKFGKLDNIHPSSNHYYYYTEYLSETPINLVIQKNTLKEFATFHFMIYRDKPYAQNKDNNIWLKKQFQRF
ncbi:hypothetical protein [Bacillus sp. UNC41MFS5]|uniref:hypothetical protein n=1 Tax=Bacillus sp. UNC41MFS5 TaxID=1449046 RepID=UPI00068EFFA2|nr:hypothetical protein [Bacillus sp. UNC41MFS5]